MGLLKHVYAAATRAVSSVLPLASPFNAKLARGIAARQHALTHLQQWALTGRDADRPLIWLHAPSVGEALMAQAIAQAIRSTAPQVQLALTIFSPSAERTLARMPVDVAGYLPWDTPAHAAAAVRALQPTAVGFVRTEVWPLMREAAAQAGAHTALVNAVLAPSSSRLRWPARLLLARVYAQLDAVGVTSAAHVPAFMSLGVQRERIRVTGDGRFDQVLERVAAADRAAPLLAALRAAPGALLVAGSTWPQDEQVLVRALAPRIRAGHLRLLVAPHEPGAQHIAALEALLDTAGLAHQRIGALEMVPAAQPAAVVIVDRTGMLADLYAAAHHAYVGGGFGSAGLHSVVEPAAHGVPVLFGPRHGNATEAAELAHEGGGAVIQSVAELRERSLQWEKDPAAYARASAAARTFVEARGGGGERNARLLLEIAGIG